MLCTNKKSYYTSMLQCLTAHACVLNDLEPCFYRFHTMLNYTFDDPNKFKEKGGRKRSTTDT